MKRLLIVLSLFTPLSHADYFKVENIAIEAMYSDTDVATLKQSLEDQGLDLNVQESTFGTTFLHRLLIVYGDEFILDGVQFILDAGADPNIVNNDNNTPLHIATRFSCFDKSEERIKEYEELIHLLATPENIVIENFLGQTPLSQAFHNGCRDEDFLKTLSPVDPLEITSLVEPGSCVCNLNDEPSYSGTSTLLNPGECVCDTSTTKNAEKNSSVYSSNQTETTESEVTQVEPETEDTKVEVVQTEPETTESEVTQAEPETDDTKVEAVQAEPETEDTKVEVVQAEPKTEDTKVEVVQAEPETEDTKVEVVQAEPETEDSTVEEVSSEPEDSEAVELEFFVKDFPVLFEKLSQGVGRVQFSNTCDKTGVSYTLFVPGKKDSKNKCEIYLNGKKDPSWTAKSRPDYCAEELMSKFVEKSCGNAPVFKISSSDLPSSLN